MKAMADSVGKFMEQHEGKYEDKIKKLRLQEGKRII